ncbi:hypothetical protein [Paenibacillus tianjinensis]|nr:hypothetical protein [Paenibacillus tianjinensis]
MFGIFGKKYAGNGSPLATTAITMAVGVVFFLPYSSFSTGEATSTKIMEAWLAVIFMALFAQYCLIYGGIKVYLLAVLIKRLYSLISFPYQRWLYLPYQGKA